MIIQYLADDDKEYLFEIGNTIFVDFRITDTLLLSKQDEIVEKGRTTRQEIDMQIALGEETISQVHTRNASYIRDISSRFPTATIITVSHGGAVVGQKKAFKDFDYLTQKQNHYPKNGTISTRYRDNERHTEVDLHKPYVDTYRFVKEGKTYKRIPEVMDCWFESGAMPFGQDHYIGQIEDKNKDFTADFIAEGLDQTRGRFRSLHVLGHAIKGKNAAKHIVVNGLVLAEDGKKMSKSLKNYPDPRVLIEKRGGDTFRLYCLSSPVVRAEPMRFTEKGVEQAFRDFQIPLQNVYNFFETYAKIDGWKHNDTQFFFMRHAEAERVPEQEDNAACVLTKEGEQSLVSEKFREEVLRVNPDIIIENTLLRVQKTALAAQRVVKEFAGKEVEILSSTFSSNDDVQTYFDLLNQHKGKKILMIGNGETFTTLWGQIFGIDKSEIKHLDNTEIIEISSYQITNDLDKWILSELHATMLKLHGFLGRYILDEATKTAMDFMDKLTNRYLRRSRRRFRANGMDQDKYAAYATLYEVLRKYLLILAPFAPFITEHLWLNLAGFQEDVHEESIHLQYRPMMNKRYINPELMEEIAEVRKIIKSALFIRARNKIAVKQPLQKLEVKID